MRGYAPRFFEPKLGFAKRLRPSACIDITDGLSLDLHRMLLASGVSAELSSIPLVHGATEEQALTGGDEYELLYSTRRPSPGIEIEPSEPPPGIDMFTRFNGQTLRLRPLSVTVGGARGII